MGIITISRTYGSGGTVLAQELAKRLNYEYVIDRTFVQEICKVRKDHVCAFGLEDEEAPSFFDRIQELMSSRNFYKTALMANIYDFASRNNVIFVGMGAHIILSGLPNVINIQVVELMSDRVKAIAQIKKILYDDAFELIKKMDNEKKKFVAHYFDQNIYDPTLYHLIINSSYVTIDNAIDMVLNYCNKYFTPQLSEETEKILKNRLLEKRAEILLFRLGLVSDFGKITFEAKEEGVLTVKGIVGGKETKRKLFDALEHIKEANKIEDQVKVGILSRNIY